MLSICRMFLLLLLAMATAGPRFLAEDPHHAALATEAWREAIACTGREAPAAEEVPILRKQVRGGFGGVAVIGQAGLSEIHIIPGPVPDHTITHEVSHAWVHVGPEALVEGRTNLLADCIDDGLGLSWSRHPLSLSSLPDLLTWDNPEVTTVGTRSDGYAGSTQLAYAMAEVLGPELLFEAEPWTDWGEPLDLLVAQGPEGRLLAELLLEGPEGQRRALSDADGDGRMGFVEMIDEELQPPEGATLLRADNSTQCSGWRGEEPMLWTVGTRHGVVEHVDLSLSPDGGLVRLPSELARVGGEAWVLPQGPVQAYPRCIEVEPWLVFDHSQQASEDLLWDLALEVGWSRRSGRWQLMLELGTDSTQVLDHSIQLTSSDLEQLASLPDHGLRELVEVWRGPADQRPQATAAVIQRASDARIAAERRHLALALEAERAAIEFARTQAEQRARFEAEERERSEQARLASELFQALDAPRQADLQRRDKEAAEAAARARKARRLAVYGGLPEPTPRAAFESEAPAPAPEIITEIPEIVDELSDPQWSEDFEASDPCLAWPGEVCEGQTGVLARASWGGVRSSTLEGLVAAVDGDPYELLQLEVGAATSGIDGSRVLLGREEVAWAQARGRLDVLVALAGILATYADMGIEPDSAAVNQELAIAVGHGLLEVRLD